MDKKTRWSEESEFEPKLYKVDFSEETNFQKTEVNEIEQDPNKRIIVVFPGSTEGANKDASSDNAAKSMNKLLTHYGVKLDNVDVYAATYYHQYPRTRTRENVDLLTADPSNWYSEDAEILSRAFLPLIAEGGKYENGEFKGDKKPISEIEDSLSRVTFFGKSKGTLLCREVENCLKHIMKDEYGYSDIEIKSSLKELFSVGVANIFLADNSERLSRGAYFTSVTDTKAKKYFPDFENVVRLRQGGQTRVRFSHHSSNRVTLATVDIPTQLTLVDEKGNAFQHNDETVHKFNSYIGIRENPLDNTVPLAVTNLLLHGITREPRNQRENNIFPLINSMIESAGDDEIAPVLRDKLQSKPKVMLWAESLVGGGHINYIGTVGTKLAEKGYDVTLVTGSKKYKMPDIDIKGVKVVDLPGIYGEFNTGVTFSENNTPIEQDAEWQDNYREALLEAHGDIEPDILITEFWPIRRGPLDFAMLPLMEQKEQVNPDTQMCCLVRDYVHMSVTNYGAGGDDISAANTFQQYFGNGKILVHTIKDIMALEESMNPEAVEMIKENVEYVGYIIPKRKPLEGKDNGVNRDKVLVTCGAGWTDYCEDTNLAIIKSLNSPESKYSNDRVIVLVPHDTPDESYKKIEELVAQNPNAELSYNRKDFGQLMKEAKAIFSHGGNTIVEAIDSNIPDIFVTPRMEKGQIEVDSQGPSKLFKMSDGVTKEQLARAVAFANAGYISLITPENLETDITPLVNDHSQKNKWVLNAQKNRLCSGAERASSIIHDEYMTNHPEKSSIMKDDRVKA